MTKGLSKKKTSLNLYDNLDFPNFKMIGNQNKFITFHLKLLTVNQPTHAHLQYMNFPKLSWVCISVITVILHTSAASNTWNTLILNLKHLTK